MGKQNLNYIIYKDNNLVVEMTRLLQKSKY